MRSLASGLSVEGRAIEAYAFGRDGVSTLTLVFAGIHGDEPGAPAAALRLLDHFAARPPAARIVIAPAVNPDGLHRDRKNNAHDVDLNRNFPSRNWRPEHRPGYFPGTHPSCEPETAWLAALVASERPRRIVSIHQPFRCVNFDGPAEALAERMAAACGWPAVADLGYPTPGSFGSFAGLDLGLEVITLELPRPATDEDLALAEAALRVACEPPPR